MYNLLSGLFAFIIAFTASIGLPVYKEETGINNIAQTVNSVSGETDITFDKQKVNTVEIEFESKAESLVEIYNGDELVYSRSSDDIYRFCAFPSIETDCLTIKLSGVAKSVTVSLKQSENKDFRVTSYVVAQNVQSPESIRPEDFDVITDAILFGCVTFDENADISVNTEQLETALSNLRNAIGNRDVNIYINILGPGSDGGADWNEQMKNQGEKHSKAFKTGKLEKRIDELLSEYSFDGVFFDYEYPVDKEAWRNFNRFLVKLNRTTDKKIGAAVAHWNLGFSYSAIKALDMVELMQYDLFDSQGNHSSFTSAVDGFNSVRDYLLPREKVDMGLPFYGRPATGEGYWPAYNEFANELGKNTDFAETSQGKAYFNSWQTVYDKTAYAMSRGLGGMMVWHYTCDASGELSLFAGMGDCIQDRIV